MMPGTLASLAAVGLLYLIYRVAHPSPMIWELVLVGGLMAGSAATIALGRWANAYFGRKDAPAVVADEVAGICLTWLMQPMVLPVVTAALVFAAFRLFDITKPWPARRLERLPGGWGVLADDLAAAVYGNLVCQVILRVL
jgi:phosphatidylglycerophosphatase A